MAIVFTPSGPMSVRQPSLFRPKGRQLGGRPTGGGGGSSRVSTRATPTPSASELFGTAAQREAQLAAFRSGGRAAFESLKSRTELETKRKQEQPKRTPTPTAEQLRGATREDIAKGEIIKEDLRGRGELLPGQVTQVPLVQTLEGKVGPPELRISEQRDTGVFFKAIDILAENIEETTGIVFGEKAKAAIKGEVPLLSKIDPVSTIDTFFKFALFSPLLVTGATAKTTGKGKSARKQKTATVKRQEKRFFDAALDASEEAFKKGVLKNKLIEVSDDIARETNTILRNTKINNLENFLNGLKQRGLIKSFILDKNTGAIGFLDNLGVASRSVTKASPQVEVLIEALLLNAPQISKTALAVTGAITSKTEVSLKGPSEGNLGNLKAGEKGILKQIDLINIKIRGSNSDLKQKSLQNKKSQLEIKLNKNLKQQGITTKQVQNLLKVQTPLKTQSEKILQKKFQRQLDIQRDRFGSLSQQSSTQKQLLEVASALATAQTIQQKQKLRQRQKQLQDQLTKQQQLQKQGQSLKQLQKTKQLQKQKTQQQQLQKQKFKAKVGFQKTPGLRLKAPPLLFLRAGEKKRKLKKKVREGIFKVHVRKFGKDIQIGTFKTKPEAKINLKIHLSKTLRASGFITKGDQRVQLNLGKQFRPSKSKKLKDVFRVVEKRRFRLDSRSEVKSIQIAKEQKMRIRKVELKPPKDIKSKKRLL